MSGPGHCDECRKERKDVRSCGRDANGDPDAPDLCFFCRKKYGMEGARRRRSQKSKTNPKSNQKKE